MKKNMGSTDRIVRMIAGIAFILGALFLTTGVLDVILYVFGAIFIITSIIGFCPLYVPLNINTNK